MILEEGNDFQYKILIFCFLLVNIYILLHLKFSAMVPNIIHKEGSWCSSTKGPERFLFSFFYYFFFLVREHLLVRIYHL